MTKPQSRDKHPQSSELLLPWYVNGTLSEKEMDQVSRDAQASSDIAEQVNQEIQLAQRWREQCEPLDSLLTQESLALAQLTDKLTVNNRFARRFFIDYKTAAVVFLGLGLMGLLTMLPLNEHAQDRYRTLSTGTTVTSGVVLQVIFHPETTEREMRTLMMDGNAHVLSGPTPQGIYRLELPAHIDGAQYAKRLQQHPAIRWAELEVSP